MSGAASAVIVERNPSFHEGRPPVKAHADCAATPSATYSPGVGMITGVSMTADRQCCSDERFAPPPTSKILPGSTPQSSIARSPSARPHAIDSTVARASPAGVRFERLIPLRIPRAFGLFGVRSPAKNGSSVSASSVGNAVAASASKSAKSIPSSLRTASSTCPALSVHTRGRNWPVASANPLLRRHRPSALLI